MMLLTHDQIRNIISAPEIYQRLGVDPTTRRSLVVDGDVGPRTRGALYLDPRAITTPVAHVSLEELLDGAQEVGRGNRGPWVEKYARGWREEGESQGPWCAFEVSWCYDQVAPFPRVGGAIRLVRDHLERVPPHAIAPDDSIAWNSMTRPWPAGHVGLVAALEPDWVWTLEGNVDLKPGLDGVAARCLPRATLRRSDGAMPLYCGRRR